jgi:hypothetical protein
MVFEYEDDYFPLRVSELIDLLLEQEKDGHGDYVVVVNRMNVIPRVNYDSETETVGLTTEEHDVTVTDLRDIEPDEEEEEQIDEELVYRAPWDE